MKNLTTTLIALFAIATSTFADNNTPAAAASLKATATSNTVVLNFSSAAASFEIERSFYSNGFTTIATVNMPFAGTLSNFRINDTAAELSGRAIAYYRVKQISANGTVTYSNITVVNLHNNGAAVKTATAVNFTAAQNGTAVITVKSTTGKVAATVNSLVAKGSNTIAISNNLAKGIYVAEIAVNGVVTGTQKIVAE
jgi:hypothetical protein